MRPIGLQQRTGASLCAAAIVTLAGASLEAQPKNAGARSPPASPPATKSAPPAGSAVPTPIPSAVNTHPNPDIPPISTIAREVRDGFESLAVPETGRSAIAVKVKVPDGLLHPSLVGGAPVPASLGNGAAAPSADRTGRPLSLAVPLAAQDRFVDVVAVGDATHFFCTGIVVAHDWVLTARHCHAATRVLFGNDILAAASIIDVDRIVEPPGPALDAALLHLSVPVRIATRDYRRNVSAPSPNGFVRLVGFGATDVFGSRGFGVKREVDIPVAGWACEGLRARSYACTAGAELVLPRPGLGDACRGDSGGPVLELYEGRYRLVAITSRSIPGRGRLCGDGGIYTRVDALAPWMASVFGGTSE